MSVTGFMPFLSVLISFFNFIFFISTFPSKWVTAIFYWDEAAYDSAMHQVGFRNIKWRPIAVSDAGLKAYGADYWQAYLRKPYGIVLEGFK